MTEQPSAQIWTQLRADRPHVEDRLTLQAVMHGDEETAISMGVDHVGALHLLIPVSRAPSSGEPPDLNGLKVRHRLLETGRYLDLVAAPSHEAVFTPFCRQVIEAVHLQRREPWAAVAATIRAWQSAWRQSREFMDKATQVGLVGELYILRHLMIACLGAQAVYHWSGPDRERHDFVSEQLHIEVKTTRRSRHEHEISRADQLTPPTGGQLLLASVQLEETIGGDTSLATLIDDITGLLRTDAAALDTFLAKLSALGWTDEMRRSGELVRFALRHVAIFEVDEDFPRLPDDFDPPSGIVAIRYTISLANLPTLDVGEVSELVRLSARPD